MPIVVGVGDVAGNRAKSNRQRSLVPDSAAAAVRLVAGESAVDDSGRATVKKSAAVAQAGAAAAKAAAILSKNEIQTEARISEVLDANCDGCAYCVEPCPFKAITLVEYISGEMVKKTVESDPAKCQGCGVCMATCPKKGIMVKNFDLEELSDLVAAVLIPA